jgi:hypothetical protein
MGDARPPAPGEDEARRLTEYARGTYLEVREWYRQAEVKAQLILAVNGLLVAAIATAVLGNPQNSAKLIAALHPGWRIMIALAIACVASSVVIALFAVISKLYSRSEIERRLEEDGIERATPETAWFFQFHAHRDSTPVLGYVLSDPLAEPHALLANLRVLSERVERKHRRVNYSLYLTTTAITILLLVGVAQLAWPPA